MILGTLLGPRGRNAPCTGSLSQDRFRTHRQCLEGRYPSWHVSNQDLTAVTLSDEQSPFEQRELSYRQTISTQLNVAFLVMYNNKLIIIQ